MFSATNPQPQDGLSKFHPLILQYFAAIGFDPLDATFKLSLAAVESLMAQHSVTFAMTSLPANMQNDVRLDFENLASYLLTNRYGFCFHHNVVAYNAFKQLGFDVSLLAGYVRKPPQYTESFSLPTHVVILLKIEGKRYLLDPAWGADILKPLLLDSADDSQRFFVKKLADERYAFVEHHYDQKTRARYEFSTTPVVLNDLEKSLKNVMSPDHVFYKSFFLEKKIPGYVHSIVGRKYALTDAKGQRCKEFEFGEPAKGILRTIFDFTKPQIDHINNSTFANPLLGKMVKDFKFSENTLKNILSFLNKKEHSTARQIASEWRDAPYECPADVLHSVWNRMSKELRFFYCSTSDLKLKEYIVKCLEYNLDEFYEVQSMNFFLNVKSKTSWPSCKILVNLFKDSKDEVDLVVYLKDKQPVQIKQLSKTSMQPSLRIEKTLNYFNPSSFHNK